MNKTKLIFISFILLSFSIYSCENDNTKNIEMLYSFFEDIFSEKKSLEQISELYRYKGTDVKFKDEANELFKKHIKFILTEKKHLTNNKTDLTISSYNESMLDGKWKFEQKDHNNIYVVNVNDKIETYVLIKNDKILSLAYFRKGRESIAYFLPYYEKSAY